MEEFLAGSVFKYAVFPLVSAGLGVFLKYVSRNDQYLKFKKEDIAIGPDLLLTACLTMLVLISDRSLKLVETNKNLASMLNDQEIPRADIIAAQSTAQFQSSQLTGAVFLIAAMLVGLWGLSTVVRRWGWRSENDMHPFAGIALPLGIGLLSILYVMSAANQ